MHCDVMLIEDDDDSRMVTGDLLESRGHSVASFENGQLALWALNDGHHPKVILLDLLMPVMDGWQFLADFRRLVKLQHIPIVVVTGVDPNSHLGPWPANIAAGFLKPFDVDTLLYTVETACGPCPTHKCPALMTAG